jgi:hypothetical protein
MRLIKVLIALVVIAALWKALSGDADVDVEYEEA